MLRNTTIRHVLFLLFLAFFLRILNFSFPAFTADEARIAFRGYEISHNGVDELGRKFPYLFNSLDDYQFPVASQLSALGAGIFGKSEFAARLPFIAIGLILVLLTYKVATKISSEKSFPIVSALVVATSPVLIFVSKVPNEPIVAVTLFLLLFYLLNREKLNLVVILFTMILLIFTAKFSWFILFPFVMYTIFLYENALKLKDKLKLSLISLALVILAFSFFMQIPQGMRSLSENNWSLFSDITTKNGINRIRGQGIESGWPPILEQLLINKLHFLSIGTLHWLSNIQPAVFFSQFSKDGNLDFIGMGAFPKVTIIPALMGSIFLIRQKRSKLLLYPVIITLPTALIYPQFSPQVVILTLPFIAYIIAFGFLQAKRILGSLIFIFMGLELLINFFFLSPQVKMTNELRPNWIKPIVQDAYRFSNSGQVFISDNLTQDTASFIEWYTSLKPQSSFSDIPYPYKMRQTIFSNVRLVGLSDNFWACDKGKRTRLFLTERDLNKVKNANGDNMVRTYLDNKDKVAVYLLEDVVCLN